MYLELHDTEKSNTLVARIGGRVGLDYDYQAEQWVHDTFGDENSLDPRPNRWVVLWILLDEHGVRARWERPSGDKGRPKLVHAAARFQGEWKVGT